MARSSWRFVAVVTCLLILGISWGQIPKANIGGHEWGIDFYNLHTYHHCQEFKNFPYQGEGEACLDSRGMVYPPLMYWLFTWVRGLSFEISYGVLIGLIIIGVFMAGLALPGETQKKKYLWFAPLLLLQFPSAFAIERGNNDIFVVFIWLGLMVAWYHKHFWLAGLAAAVAVQAKVYPMMAVGLLGLVWIYLWSKKNLNDNEKELKRQLNPFVIGFLATSGVLFLLLWEQNCFYWFKVLPQWANQRQGRHATVHGLGSILPSVRLIGPLAAGLLGYIWLRLVYRYLLVDPVLVLSGLLAISTYFQGVSNDYNLVTVYPLFALLFLRAVRKPSSNFVYAGLLFVGIFAGLGYKWFWGNSVIDIVGLHIMMQLFWLILIAAFHLRPKGTPTSTN